jgi:hypothetical protein
MEFRLIYKGTLPAAGSGGGGRRTREKHELRKLFHKQLKELWKQHPELRRQSERQFVRQLEPWPDWKEVVSIPSAGIGGNRTTGTPRYMGGALTPAKTWLEHIADDYPRCGTHFVPLLSKIGGFTCSLNILFLRRGNPGDLIKSGGDIDNRLKVLLDGLVMPSSVTDLGGLPIEADEDPFFVLLEDDVLVTNISVTTDRLLTPQETDERINDVNLVIHVAVHNQGTIFAGGRLV